MAAATSLAAPAGAVRARRILVVAEAIDASVAGEVLLRAAPAADVAVLAPPLPRRSAYRGDGAAAAARARLACVLDALRAGGVEAHGAVGDVDPVRALDDAVAEEAPDAILVVSGPPDRPRWLGRGLVAAARARYGVPVTRIVVADAGEALAAPTQLGRAELALLVSVAVGPLIWALAAAAGRVPPSLAAVAVAVELGATLVWLGLARADALGAAGADDPRP